jgi:hypothetical protein
MWAVMWILISILFSWIFSDNLVPLYLQNCVFWQIGFQFTCRMRRVMVARVTRNIHNLGKHYPGGVDKYMINSTVNLSVYKDTWNSSPSDDKMASTLDCELLFFVSMLMIGTCKCLVSRMQSKWMFLLLEGICKALSFCEIWILKCNISELGRK